MDPFVYTLHPMRVIFGSGKLQCLPEEVQRLGSKHPLLLSTPGSTERLEALASLLAGHVSQVSRFEGAVMHTPIEVSEEASRQAIAVKADCLISLGGGSTVGLGKAIKLRLGLPHISIPTTYAGSEMTAMLGESTEGGGKKTMISDKVRVDTVIYDVDLTMTLPKQLSAVSGVNAIAHAVEALYARDRNPVIDLMARDGIRSLAEALPEIMEDATAKNARSRALYGAWLCSICAGSVQMALHHKLCHTLGGSFKLPHAETHNIVLPHALAYNAPDIPAQMAMLADVIPHSNGDAIHGLNTLLSQLGVRRALRDLGMREEQVHQAVSEALQRPYWNPRKLEKIPLEKVIRRCWAEEAAKQDI